MKSSASNTYFLQGNEACVEAAVIAGCRFFAGYPISPANEIAERMSTLLPKVDGIFMQMEDELASINAIMGASWAGKKTMTATSGPGFSLMQETIGWAFMTETPCVIVDVQRVGPGTGQATKCAQGDVMQSRWGTHGDYSAIALSPNSVQEMFELTIRAFNLAEKYRTPVILLTDETIAHLREQVTIPPLENIRIINRKKPEAEDKAFFGLEEVAPMPAIGEGFNVAVTASTHDEYGVRFTADPSVHTRIVRNINDKIRNHADDIADVESYNIDNCQVGIVSYGCTSRAVHEAVEEAERKGIETGYVRLKTVWPFPEKAVKRLAQAAKKLIVPEMNLGQIFYEVKRAACSAEVIPINKIGGGELIAPEEILAEIERGNP
ncbi:MAG: 2-oxoacid:acceptor oxidoreductase subunit alpha [Candidatus Bathyarchaeota archaeon]|nr:2-oxoacid:acceptor oxidoreductase subunit alpha [Candidatus Bathyarchaeota archaeon]MDH5787108.1 2-oxoacid:acceptor oxidoreductase subunit alpha [Candidatus Bathyarchaeota archaeon]